VPSEPAPLLRLAAPGRDDQLAARYADSESATTRARRRATEQSARRQYRHKHGGATQAARTAQTKGWW
jgi:hypothetical protein